MKKSQKKIESKKENEKMILCTECGEPYEPASPHADIRCANCGNHQDPIVLASQFMKRSV